MMLRSRSSFTGARRGEPEPPSGGPPITANLIGHWNSRNVTLDSGITGITDLSGNGRHFTVTSATKSELVADVLNGHPAIKLTGGPYYDTGDFSIAQPITTYLIIGDKISQTNARILTHKSSNGDWRLLNHLSDTIRFMANAITGFSTGDYDRGTFVAAGASSLGYANDDSPTTVDVSGGINGIRLGANATGGSGATINVVEIIMYSAAHDSTDRATMQTFLKTITGET